MTRLWISMAMAPALCCKKEDWHAWRSCMHMRNKRVKNIDAVKHRLFEAFGGAEEKGLSRGWGGGDRDGWVAEGSDGVPRWKEA